MRTSEFFQKAIQRQKLSHAHLFSGNDTEQKQNIINDLLVYANIQAADQIYIHPISGEICIADIRRLSAFLSMSAWNSPYKICVVHDAHAMNKEAQSAFLKLLEEPKGDSVFFLLTEFPDLLLTTIRSRVQECKFYTYNSDVSKETLEEFKNLREVSIAVRFAAAKKLAENSDGIPQKLDQWVAAARRFLLEAVQKSSPETSKLCKTIKALQEVSYALQTSNVNPRLALERLMLDM
jgi:DNA polymerase III gamma/tau subunit